VIGLAGRLLPLVALLAWELLCDFGAIDTRFVPAPSTILACLAAPGTAGDLLGQTGRTLLRTLGGFALGSAAGLGLGLACGALRRLDAALLPLLEILRPIPSVAVIPVAVLFMGLGNGMNVSVAAFACAWPVFVAVRDAVRAVDPLLCDTARMCGLPPGRAFRLVGLPASLPGAVTGLRTALGIAVAVAVSSEMVASSDGLGHLAMSASFAHREPLAWAAVLAMGLAGGLCALGFTFLTRLVERLRPGLLGGRGRQGRTP
jgi:ABC-type nitrate/sulfonate/bicarbonate transport system permease component